MTEEMENECKMKEEWIYDGRNSNLKKLCKGEGNTFHVREVKPAYAVIIKLQVN